MMKSSGARYLLGIVTLLFVTPILAVAADSIWALDDTPATVNHSDAGASELGTKFVSSQHGHIIALRHYRAANSNGGETGRLWSGAGALLGSATFATTSVSTPGWQTTVLETPIAITAGQTYIVSYNNVLSALAGSRYAYVFTSGFFNGATTTSGALSAYNTNVSANGVFGASGSFPTATFEGGSYYADVVFVEDVNETTPPEVVASSVADGQTEVSPWVAVRVRFDEIIATSSMTSDAITLTKDGGAPVPIEVSYDTGRYEFTIRPVSILDNNTGYTLTFASTTGITDWAGNALANEFSLSFTTATVEGCPCSIWDADDLPAYYYSDGTPLELGTKFETVTSGYVTAVRFYKHLDSTGGEIGRLWTADGTQLASTTLVAVTGTPGIPGWYEARFDTPVAITASTTYVVSYSAMSSGRYVATPGYFQNDPVTNGPVTAYAHEISANGVYNGAAGSFPDTASANGASYFVDIVFIDDLAETDPPTVRKSSPVQNETNVSIHKKFSIHFSEALDETSVAGANISLVDSHGASVSVTRRYTSGTYELFIEPSEPLRGTTTYTLTIERDGGLRDIEGNLLEGDYVLTFKTELVLPTAAGGPMLVLYSEADGFSQYYAEILRAEGFTAFAQLDVDDLLATDLSLYVTMIVGSINLSTAQVDHIINWVEAGGNLILMRPEADLHELAGVTVSGTQGDGYLSIASTTREGAGLVHETIQYHGTADLYSAASGDIIASLHTGSTTPAIEPAVILRTVGTAGGQVATFAFDLARSVIYSRQGNPANAGLDVNGDGVPRPNDLFHPNYVDLSKVAIPQADEQQRLLAHLILTMSEDQMPIPRFWYLPHLHKVAIMMTIDDHSPASGATKNYFNSLIASSTPACALDDWECLRATVWTYVAPNNSITNNEASSFASQGFEFGVHVRGPEPCTAYSLDIYRATYVQQLFGFNHFYSSLPTQLTHRYHCIVWSDWSDQVEVMADSDIRLDLNYYYWPASWVQNRPGYFTGSGFPMRYTNINGFAHNVYQAPTQLVNENGMIYPDKVQEMIDLARGTQGYFGILGTHGDNRGDGFEQAMKNVAYTNNVPLITAEQALKWTDARNESTYRNLSFANGILSFTLEPASNADGLMVMLPTEVGSESLVTVRKNGGAYAHSTTTIKGIEYVVFSGTDGDYAIEYTYTPPAPTVSLSATPGSIAAGEQVTLTWSSEHATSCTGIGFPTAAATSGSAMVTPSTTSIYEISCVGEGGTATTSVTVTVVEPVRNRPGGKPVNLTAVVEAPLEVSDDDQPTALPTESGSSTEPLLEAENGTMAPVTLCHRIHAEDRVRGSFGLPWNIHSSMRSLLIEIVCVGERRVLRVGDGSNDTLVYRYAFERKPDGWKQIDLFGAASAFGTNWLRGRAYSILSDQTGSVVAFTCVLTKGQWRCGCRDEACTTASWQLQEY